MSPCDSEPGPDRIQVRLRVYRKGRVCLPRILDITRGGLEAFDRQSKQTVPLPWMQMVEAGAELLGCSSVEFVAWLREIVLAGESGPALAAPASPISGQCAPTQESHHAPGRRRPRRRN